MSVIRPRVVIVLSKVLSFVRRRPKASWAAILASLTLLTVAAFELDAHDASTAPERAAADAQRTIERARQGAPDPYDGPANPAISRPVTYSRFVAMVKADEIGAAVVPGREGGTAIAFETKTGAYSAAALPNPALAAAVVDLMVDHQVDVLGEVAPAVSAADIGDLLRAILPMLLVLGVVAYVMRRGPGGTGTPGEWIAAEKNATRFADVQGIDEAKAELVEAVEYLIKPGTATALGAKTPRGVLLVGPPGTGKTLLARAVAGEAGAAFLRLSGSDFVEMWVGLGARRVRNIFKAARKRAPCVIFIDEIDSLGRKRAGGSGGAERESDQTLNALLVELDGFARDDQVLVLAATNRLDTLDEALVRPGRFDRQIQVGLPDMKGRRAILEAHAKAFRLADPAALATVARGTPGFTGADLANLMNEAAFAASRRAAAEIGTVDFESARDRVMMGHERRGLAWREEERVLTAWHEAGHALVALLLPDSDPVHKATILPRGKALGMVMRLPEHDRFAASRAKLEADLAVAVAGRIAEELKFGADRVSTGAEADIAAATDLAHRMVARWGMSPRLGFVAWQSPDGIIEAPVREEMKALIDGTMARTRRLVTRHRAALDAIALALLDRETLDREELETILAGARFAVAAPELAAASMTSAVAAE
jgi:cell division protease FtsH